MKRTADVRDLEVMDRLIRDEIEEALGPFRAGDSEKRLRGRIAQGPEPVRSKRFLERAAVPALLAAAAGAVVLMVVTRPSVPRPVDLADIVEVLGRFSTLARPAAEPSAATDLAAGRPEATAGLEKALAIAAWLKDEDERKAPLRESLGEVPSYSMEERMRILFKDKIIERALEIVKEKSKEA